MPRQIRKNQEPGSDPWSSAAVAQNRQWLTAFLLSVTGAPDSVDDMVQEVFRIALSKRETFPADGNFGGWLRGIARNVALRFGERRKRELLLFEGDALDQLGHAAANAAEADADPDANERRVFLLRQCLRELSDRARTIIGMRYDEKIPSARIAQVLGMGVSAVDVALFRARAALAECIRGKESMP
jgi:RNA polymerase sigma-70 factor (ECF subfamily)